ncbi:unnamed protein product, partial [Rotaria sp. Silwood2]
MVQDKEELYEEITFFLKYGTVDKKTAVEQFVDD